MNTTLSEGNLVEKSPVSDNSGDTTYNEWHTGYIQGNTFHQKEVKYKIIDDMAIFQGDIILAKTPEHLEKLSQKPKVQSEQEPPAARHVSVKAIVRHGDELRWPRGEIPYVIQNTLPNQERVNDAIKHWEERTPMRFIQRNDNNARITQTTSQLYNMFASQTKDQTFFIAHQPLGCKTGENRI